MRFARPAFIVALSMLALPAAADTIELMPRSSTIPDESRSLPALFARVRDAAGNPKAGSPVTFSPGTCTSFEGLGAGEVVVASTSPDGHALSPALAFDPAPRTCVATASISAAPVAQFRLTRYSSASIEVTLLDTQAVDRELFNLAARITANGVPISGLPVSVGSATPGAPEIFGSYTTNDLGLIGVSRNIGFITNFINTYVGPMDIRVSFSGGSRIVRATQVARPRPPALATSAQSATVQGNFPTTTITLENAGPAPCTLRDARRVDLDNSGFNGVGAPRHLAFSSYAVTFVASGCSYPGSSPGAPKVLEMRIEQLATYSPPNSAFYAYFPGSDGRPAWQRIPTAVHDDNLIRFSLQDGLAGDFDGARDEVRVIGGFAVPASFQDMWWGGGNENGWGLSLMQHGETRFGVLFAYDAAGRPTWHVASDAPWDVARSSFAGPFYHPLGSPYYDYRPQSFRVGAAAGTMAWIPNADGSLSLSFAANGAPAVNKRLVRQRFDAQEAKVGRDVEDLWYGGPENAGYGVAVHQQGGTLFIAWFTYDATGERTWFVIPSGMWEGDTWVGRVYRTTSAPFAAYDASRFVATDVGRMSIKFAGSKAYVEYFVEGREGTLTLSRQGF